MKRLKTISTTLYNPNKRKQGIYNIIMIFDDVIKTVSIFEGAPTNIVASTLRDLANKIEKGD